MNESRRDFYLKKTVGKRLISIVISVLMIMAVFVPFASAAEENQVIGKLTAIEVEGNVRVNSDEIIGVIQSEIGKDITTEALNADFERIYDLGCFMAINGRFENYAGGVKLIVSVQELPVLRSVSVMGNQEVSSEELINVIDIEIGELINVNEIMDAVSALQALYQDKGYLVSCEPTMSANGDVIIYINEWVVGEVKVSGNEKTKTDVILREVRTKAGDYLNSQKLNDDARRIYNTQAFEDVQIELEPVEGSSECNIVFVVKERKTGTANTGITFSPSEGLMGYVEIGSDNFLGRLEKVNIKATFGNETNDYQLSFEEPWFFSPDNSLGLSLYHTSKERSLKIDDETSVGYIRRSAGGSASFGRSLGLNTQAYLTLRIENTMNFATDDKDENNEKIPDGGNTRSLTLSAVTDKRDDLWNPHNGYRLNGSLEYAGGVLGGDSNFVKAQASGSGYWEFVDGHVLAGRISGGTSVDVLPDSEKFAIGGGDSLRGYDYGEFEGDRMLFMNAEYRFDVVNGIQGVVFCDVGQAWDKGESIKLSDFNIGYGLGVRVTVPILGVVRLDYGFSKDGGQPYFSFGQTF